MTARRAHITSALIICTLMLAVNLGIAAPAYAREYSIPQVDIDATVTVDGSIEVREERVFSFDGSFNGVYWNLPQGEFQGRTVTVDVISAGEIAAGKETAYALTNSGDNHTYSIEGYGSGLRLKIYSRHSNEDARFVITYRINNVVLRHADVAELYWQFVTEGWEEESQNITCTVHLPVPEGQSVVPEDNVRAWGHGPIDASLAFSGNDIVYTVPGVGGSEFAEARVVFPESWLPNAEQDSSSALASILQEEQRAADETNRKRSTARVVYFGSMVVAGGAAVGSFILARSKRKAYKEALKTQFDDDYFRDVPTDDHPAVLGALYHGGSVRPEFFTATLMELTDSGNIALQHVKTSHEGFLGPRIEEDYRLVLNKPLDPAQPDATRTERDAKKINRKALYLMFDKVARNMTNEKLPSSPYPPLYFSSIQKYAKKHASDYEQAYDSWSNTVEGIFESRFTMGDTVVKPPTPLIAAGVADVVLAHLFFPISLSFGMPIGLVVAFTVPLLASGIYSIVCGASRERANEEGREVKAKLKALRRWLRDFTFLNEAIPTDVILWNRLLVMAVVLGVAEEVISQLETVLPEVIHSEYMRPMYGWYYVSSTPGGNLSLSPARAFASAVSTAHSVSTASMAGSSWSSGGGGGGGFSGGGGGGFGGGGGGGGGGAF